MRSVRLGVGAPRARACDAIQGIKKTIGQEEGARVHHFNLGAGFEGGNDRINQA